MLSRGVPGAAVSPSEEGYRGSRVILTSLVPDYPIPTTSEIGGLRVGSQREAPAYWSPCKKRDSVRMPLNEFGCIGAPMRCSWVSLL